MARPDVYDWDYVKQEMQAYIDATDDPMLKEFCLRRDVPTYDAVNDRCKIDSVLLQTVKEMQAKQECFLTRAQGINPIMAIFRLKQPIHGYTDKQQIDTTVTNRTIRVEIVSDSDAGSDE